MSDLASQCSTEQTSVFLASQCSEGHSNVLSTSKCSTEKSRVSKLLDATEEKHNVQLRVGGGALYFYGKLFGKGGAYESACDYGAELDKMDFTYNGISYRIVFKYKTEEYAFSPSSERKLQSLNSAYKKSRNPKTLFLIFQSNTLDDAFYSDGSFNFFFDQAEKNKDYLSLDTKEIVKYLSEQIPIINRSQKPRHYIAEIWNNYNQMLRLLPNKVTHDIDTNPNVIKRNINELEGKINELVKVIQNLDCLKEVYTVDEFKTKFQNFD